MKLINQTQSTFSFTANESAYLIWYFEPMSLFNSLPANSLPASVICCCWSLQTVAPVSLKPATP